MCLQSGVDRRLERVGFGAGLVIVVTDVHELLARELSEGKTDRWLNLG
jgi:hypothetical protein